MNKILLIAAGLVVAIGVGIAAATLTNKSSDRGQSSDAGPAQTSDETVNVPEKPSQEAVEGQAVTFDGSGYSPNELTVKTGGAVTFKNESDQPMWPASNVHPTHTLYSGFDPQRQINPGEEWSFTFTRAGTWGYHDHLQPNITGTIKVE